MINFTDKTNFRDLGGYKSQDGRTIKEGLIYRSAGLWLLNDEEREEFKKLGIKTILDLRNDEERLRRPDPVFEGVRYINYSGVVSKGGEGIDFSPAGMKQIGEKGQKQLEVLLNYYKQMPFDNEAFHILMDILRNHEVPFLFHCATGKDRTGIGAMIVLMALNVDEQTIFDDYMLSRKFQQRRLERKLAEEEQNIKEHPELEELINIMASVVSKHAKAVIDAIKERYGDFETYIKEEYKFTDEELKEFRDYYLE